MGVAQDNVVVAVGRREGACCSHGAAAAGCWRDAHGCRRRAEVPLVLYQKREGNRCRHNCDARTLQQAGFCSGEGIAECVLASSIPAALTVVPVPLACLPSRCTAASPALHLNNYNPATQREQQTSVFRLNGVSVPLNIGVVHKSLDLNMLLGSVHVGTGTQAHGGAPLVLRSQPAEILCSGECN